MAIEEKKRIRKAGRERITGGASLQVFDPRQGDLAFKVEQVGNAKLQKPRRSNYFTALWIREGRGSFYVDLNEHAFAAPALLFVSPYQTFCLAKESIVSGSILEFHANFFCIETYHEEVGCNGVLFNDIYGQPLLRLNAAEAFEFQNLVTQMESELDSAGLAHSEALLSYLKVFLIKGARIKVAQQRGVSVAEKRKPQVIDRLIEVIEIHYRNYHRPSAYAKLLNITPKALNKLVKSHFDKTVTTLIRERVMKHSKWQMLHTLKPVKEVAAEVGFADELYFSRLFKRSTGLAPTEFREFETAIRGGRNLSM